MFRAILRLFSCFLAKKEEKESDDYFCQFENFNFDCFLYLIVITLAEATAYEDAPPQETTLAEAAVAPKDAPPKKINYFKFDYINLLNYFRR